MMDELPGLGPQLKARLLHQFQNEAGFQQALLDESLDELLQVDGVSEKRAISWIHQARGIQTDPFAATPAAEAVQSHIIELARSYASTPLAKTKARLLHPLQTPEAALAKQAEVLQWKERAAQLPRAAIRSALRKLQPLREPKPVLDATCLIVAESNEAYEMLHAAGIGKWAHLGTKRDLQQAEQYETVLVAYDNGHISVPDFAEELPADAGLLAFCPQAATAWLKENRATLEALNELAAATGKEPLAPEPPALHASEIPSSNDLTRFCRSLAKELDEEVRARTEHLALTGAELLASVSMGGLPKRLAQVVDAVLQTGAVEIKMEYGLQVQPFVAGVPIDVDEDAIDQALHEARRKANQATVMEQRAFARELDGLKGTLQAAVDEWTQFDVHFSLGCMALDFDLQPSSWAEELRFEEGVHLRLRSLEGVQPIAYQLGGEHGIAVLTGANSGGKSTLLELISQIMICARMGLPVPAMDCRVPWVQELHLVTAGKGLDAGAFETFLRGFLPIVQGDKRRLVLADEVEAVTELEAASRILGFFMDQLSRTDSLGIIVTHLAEQVLAHATAPVRVDGIEAIGLDEHHQLVVDRCPKLNHFARSTPELIIQRMSNLSKGNRKELYDALLQRFEGTRVSTPF
ncbi:MAG: hypothetical protein ACPHK8_05500 [Thermoplasmatota archaeon]